AYTVIFDDPEKLISAYAGASVRVVCAKRSTQDLLVLHRFDLESATMALLQKELDGLGCGVEILNVHFVDVHAPPEVHFAFRDVSSATEEKHKQELMGESAMRQTLAEARGRSYRIEQEALEYLDQRVSLAKGRADAFTKRSAAFNDTRSITWLRMYLTAMESVLSGTSLVLPMAKGIDVELWLRSAEGREPPFMETKGARKGDAREEAGDDETSPEKESTRKLPEPDWFKALGR
ncbi:MAG: SPFH domain-containing protein, partial [Planctomycetota bacterium]